MEQLGQLSRVYLIAILDAGRAGAVAGLGPHLAGAHGIRQSIAFAARRAGDGDPLAGAQSEIITGVTPCQ